MWSRPERNEELASICVGAGIGHRQQTPFVVLLREIFVRKLRPVDASASSAVAFGEITSLHRELHRERGLWTIIATLSLSTSHYRVN